MSERDLEDKNLEDAEILISKTLRIGVAVSAGITALGLVLFLITGNSGYPGATFPTSMLEIGKGFLDLKPYAVILSGLFVLVLTPVIRVGVSIVTFFREKDYLYVVITATVFVILIISFLMGNNE
ncbi:DUF1634 domain-containing protein [Clostridium sp. HBUAS56010]|uniref:DUF1634 domain-containing protein n=1 Tax=Clostridium sp. HBUAS56010 TaxID=2571127 RepID=UPI001178696C|nr:DUF1634 domain-containing protein [Clostridium sp. HBUAS56010]